MNLAPVLKIVNDLANDTAAAVCGHRCIKVNFAMGAVGASERRRYSALEGLGTLLAKWRNDTHGFCFALIAEMLVGLSFAGAESAYRRVQSDVAASNNSNLRNAIIFQPRTHYYPSEDS